MSVTSCNACDNIYYTSHPHGHEIKKTPKNRQKTPAFAMILWFFQFGRDKLNIDF